MAETIPEKKPQKRLTVDSCSACCLFFPVSFLEESAALPPSGQAPLPLHAWLVPLANQAPPQSSVPWHAGALWSPRSLLSLKGPLLFPSTPGAPGLLSQRHILSTHFEMPQSTPWLCAAHSQVLVSELRLEQQLHAARSSPDARQAGETAYPEENATSVPNLCPLPCSLLEDCCPCHPISVQKIPVDILLILPRKQRGCLLCSVSLPLLPLTQDDQEKPAASALHLRQPRVVGGATDLECCHH